MPTHIRHPCRRKNVRIYFRRDVFARTLIFVGPTVSVRPCGGGMAEGPHEEIAVAISFNQASRREANDLLIKPHR
jgi:hypothetical protein